MPKLKWNEGFYVRAYELARTGLSGAALAEALGIDSDTLVRWRDQKPYFAEAIRKGREHCVNTAGEGKTFSDYVYDRLSPEAQALWDEIEKLDNGPTSFARITALVGNRGKQVRQHLFLKAFAATNFNKSEACRRVGIRMQELLDWQKEGDFGEILRTFQDAKKDLYESALVALVRMGDSPATIFANKTLNRDRGYGEKVGVEVSGTVKHEISVVTVDELNLPIEVRRAILAAERERQRCIEEEQRNTLNGQVVARISENRGSGQPNAECVVG